MKVFNKFGEVKSCKLMQPRREEGNRRSCAFIRFDSFPSAYLAKEHLKEKHLFGMGLRITWGKNIPQQIRSQGYLEDYRGVNRDTELEMQFMETQLSMYIHKSKPLKDEEILDTYQKLSLIKVKMPGQQDRYVIDKLAKSVAREGAPVEEEIK